MSALFCLFLCFRSYSKKLVVYNPIFFKIRYILEELYLAVLSILSRLIIYIDQLNTGKIAKQCWSAGIGWNICKMTRFLLRCRAQVLLGKETIWSWPKASDFFLRWRFVDNLLAWTPTKFPATPLITGWYEAIFGYFLMVWFKMVPTTNNTWVFKCSSCFGQKLQLIVLVVRYVSKA